ncbi:MAG: hypothetical protein ABI186_03475 [Candidatus Elarobacter sp.]
MERTSAAALKNVVKRPPLGNSGDRAVKRSVTVRRDLNQAILESVGSRQYSAFVNEALVLALQARGIEESIADFERENPPLTPAEIRAAQHRRAKARTKPR